MHLCACVSEEGKDGEGAGSQELSDTLRYINLAGLAIGLVTFRTVRCTIVNRSCRIRRVCIFCENVRGS
jgi:hypothetical protein